MLNWKATTVHVRLLSLHTQNNGVTSQKTSTRVTEIQIQAFLNVFSGYHGGASSNYGFPVCDTTASRWILMVGEHAGCIFCVTVKK
jgi:hypothetical protein